MKRNVYLLPTELVGEKLSANRVTDIVKDAAGTFLAQHPEIEAQTHSILDEVLSTAEALAELTDGEIREAIIDSLEELLDGAQHVSNEELLPAGEASDALARIAFYDASLLVYDDNVVQYPFQQSERAAIYKEREFQNLYNTILTDCSDKIKEIRAHGGYPAASLKQVLDTENVRAQFDVYDGIHAYDSVIESIHSLHGALPHANVYQISSHPRWRPMHPDSLRSSEDIPTQ